MALLLYKFFLCIYKMAAWALSFVNTRAKLWVDGRKNLLNIIAKQVHPSDRPVWIHCASLGEFEQGRPIIEALRNDPVFGNPTIVLTFFSPSGYQVQRNYPDANHIFYLPMDSASNARAFYNVVQPRLVIFIKYEFWFYYLQEGSRRNIPILLVSGIFRSHQPFFKWYGQLHRKMLGFFAHFFVQHLHSAQLLQSAGIAPQQITISGDTRFDRVVSIAQQFEPISVIKNFCGNYPVVVAGSTWSEDDKVLDHYANTHPEVRFIIAPHNIDSSRLKECRQLYKNAVLFSEAHLASQETNTLIIDNVGMLNRLYKYAACCYVGGGFGADGVHNVLEAAVFGKPVVIGPEYSKFIEAVELVDAGGCISIENAIELEQVFDELLTEPEYNRTVGTAAYNYVQQHQGATAKVIQYIYENRLLTR